MICTVFQFNYTLPAEHDELMGSAKIMTAPFDNMNGYLILHA